MKFNSLALAVAVLFTSSGLVLAGDEKHPGSAILLKDDQQFWNRVLPGLDASMTPPPTLETPPPTPETPPPTPEAPPPTPETPPPTPETPPPTPETPPPTPATPPPTRAPTQLPPAGILEDCLVQIDVECLPPANPDPDGTPFEDCDSINLAPAECTEFVNLLTFRFNGGDCLDSNNIQDPRIYSCEDFFDGPPASDDIGAEAYMIITDIKGQGIIYYDGIVKVGDVFNITNILPNPVIIANVNVTVYEGSPAPENIRETIIIHTSCSQVTFLKDRYGVLELLGFQNPTQGYQNCLTSVSFDFSIGSTLVGANAVVESLTVITNFDEPNALIDYTDQVVGTPLAPGDTLSVSSDPITIDFSVRKRYTVVAIVQGAAPDGFTCRNRGFANFTAGNIDTRPTPSPATA